MTLTRLGLLAPLALLCCAQAAPQPEVIGFPSDVVEAHRLTGSTTIATSLPNVSFAGDAHLRVTIDTGGNVTDVSVDKSGLNLSDPAPAIAAARDWKFRPFEYRGRPVSVVTSIDVDYQAKQDWADPNAAFPAIDYATLRIELIRGGCFGPCPVYRVSIAGDGTVTYNTTVHEDGAGAAHQAFNPNGVLVVGKHRAKIDRAALDGLIAQFRAARFFGLKKEYAASITDASAYMLRFSTGGQTMEVVDYVGQMIGMPDVVKTLENEVDRVAGTARWVTGDATTVPGLIAEGLDPRSPAAVALAQTATMGKGEQVVLDLLAAGLPLDAMAQREREPRARPLGEALLSDALRVGQPRLALALIARGWLPKLPAAERASLFAENAGGCDPEVAKALVAAGTDPNAHASAKAKMIGLNGGGTALHALRAPYSGCGAGIDRSALAKALVALGADPNATDAEGETPIYGVEDPALLATFLAAGARADVKNRNGNSPAFGSETDLIVLTLLDAGADPHGKGEGKTLPMIAGERDMPATAAWLAAHGIR